MYVDASSQLISFWFDFKQRQMLLSLSLSVPLLAVWQQKTWGGPIDASLNLFVPSPMWGLEYISGSIPEAHLHLSLCLASFFLSLLFMMPLCPFLLLFCEMVGKS